MIEKLHEVDDGEVFGGLLGEEGFEFFELALFFGLEFGNFLLSFVVDFVGLGVGVIEVDHLEVLVLPFEGFGRFPRRK